MKRPWQSKTLWLNFVLALAALVIPGFDDLIANNPIVSVLLQAGLNLVLRLITKEPVIMPANKNLIPLLAALLLCSCSKLKLRYDGAPSPLDQSYPSLLLETKCGDADAHYNFGVGQCAFKAGEPVKGQLNIYTPVPSAIHLYSRECGVDQSQFTDKGGRYSYDLSDLLPSTLVEGTTCVLKVLVRWQLPPDFETGGLEVRGLAGVVYLQRIDATAEKATLEWLPENPLVGKHLGIISSQWRESKVMQTTPLRLKVTVSEEVTDGGIWALMGCGVQLQDNFKGREFYVDANKMLQAGEKLGECMMAGAAVGRTATGSLNDRFSVVKNIFGLQTVKLTGKVYKQGNQVCYEAEDTVSLTVFLDEQDEGQVSGKLSGCFKAPSGKVGFYTHKGRAAYVRVYPDGQIAWLQ